MQFPESWLRSFCNPPISTTELADLLTMAGLEVEEEETVAPAFNDVIVAQVLEAVKHPDADRLNVCKVDIGTGNIAYAYDWNWKAGSPYNAGGGDTSNGVGHFRSKTNAGRIAYNMLATTCTTGCANGYAGVNGPAFNR